MLHDFTKHSLRKLIDLKSGFMGTLKNEKCEPIWDNIHGVIKQVDIELERRGIYSLKLKKVC